MGPFLNIVKHKYFKISATIAMLVFLPAILVFNQTQQDPRTRAEKSTTLSFSPTSTTTSPIVKNVGENFYLDLILNPGTNLISLVKLDILYDPTKINISPTNPISINEVIFPHIVEGPVYTSGRIQLTLSVGSDQTKVVSTQNRALTVGFVAKATSNQSVVSFGPNNQVFSISASDSSAENSLSSTSPAFIKITKATGKNNGGNGKGKR